jgi:hypothetical protein
MRANKIKLCYQTIASLTANFYLVNHFSFESTQSVFAPQTHNLFKYVKQVTPKKGNSKWQRESLLIFKTQVTLNCENIGYLP